MLPVFISVFIILNYHVNDLEKCILLKYKWAPLFPKLNEITMIMVTVKEFEAISHKRYKTIDQKKSREQSM
jgi:hypothetical protein